MRIVKIEGNPNGSHHNHFADHITTVPEGWAMIPDGFAVPDSFPFVDLEAEEQIHYRKVVTLEGLVEQPFTAMTVTAMTEREVPPAPEPEPSWQERQEAQLVYTAMMTDTLLEV